LLGHSMKVIILLFILLFLLPVEMLAQSWEYSPGIECVQFRDCMEAMPKGKIAATVVYLADMADYDAMNRVYQTYFPTLKPARNTVQAKLGPGTRMVLQATRYTGAGSLRGLTPPNVTNVVPITPGVFAGDRLFIAGILGRDSNSGAIPEPPAAQVDLCLKRLENIFRAADLKPAHAMQFTAYHTAKIPREVLDQALRAFFSGKEGAAFTIVEVSALALGANVAINGIVNTEMSESQTRR